MHITIICRKMKQTTEDRLRKIWRLLVIVSATALLIYQVSLNVKVFLAKPTILKVSLEPMEVLQLPPISVCPFPPFKPDFLKDLGVNISGNYMEVGESLSSLNNLAQDTSVSLLWTNGSWDLGQVIESVTIMDKTEYYNMSLTEAPNWRRTYSSFGPCYTFFPPVNISEIGINLRESPYIKPCSWTYENGEVYTYNPGASSCDKVTQLCNSSCGFENYIHFNIKSHDHAYVFYHRVSAFIIPDQETLEDTVRLSRDLFEGNYKLVTVPRMPNPMSLAQLVEKFHVKGSCVSDRSYNYEKCHHEKLQRLVTKRFECSPVTHQTFFDTVNSTCSTPNLIKEIAKFYESKKLICNEKCHSKVWSHDMKYLYITNFAVFLSAASSEIRKEVEVETYPLALLISDTGGSLGLFLSLSVFFGWKLIVHCLEYISRMLKCTGISPFHFKCLMEYAGIIALFAATSTHCLIVLQSYFSQPKLTLVSLKYQSAERIDHIRDVLARRLASRALGCQEKETFYNDRLTHCLLLKAVKEIDSISPFINVDDLPYCEENSGVFHTHGYIVPSDLLIATTWPRRLKRCSKVLESHNIYPDISNETSDRESKMHVDNSYYSIDVLLLSCNLGGVCGLYLGCSIIQGIDFSVDNFKKKATCINLKCYISFMRYLKFAIVMFGIFLTAWLVVRFYFFRSFSVSVMSESGKHSKPTLVLTVCRWPPLDINYLAENEEFNISGIYLKALPLDERLLRVVQSLDVLGVNKENSVENIFNRAAWNLSDVIGVTTDGKSLFNDCTEGEMYCENIWHPMSTMMNKCYAMNDTNFNVTHAKIVLTFPKSVEKKDVFGSAPQIYFAITPFGESPLLSEMIPKHPYERIIATMHSAQYKSLHVDSVQKTQNSSYRGCIHKCLLNSFTKSYGCRLPYMIHLSSGQFCNYTQYLKIPQYFKGLEGVNNVWYDQRSQKSLKETSRYWKYCYTSCRHHNHMFFELSVERYPDPFPNVEIRMKPEDLVIVAEVETQTIPQLISDIGGIAGITIGFSMLLLLKIVVPKSRNDKYNAKA
ncbi:uncharacterized protein [Palaemon carinicauda]|uniref:uncharacterized protein n=1 Tax=Palaemon carinicauda TaxID=392227 RepID=UPI0035B639E4